jgi:dephospho-CoA kinase
MTIIGLTGTLGSGKGTMERLKKAGRPINHDTMVEIGNKLREENGPGFLAEELLRQAKRSKENCIIESIRTVGEINSLRKGGGDFYLIAVDADPEKRYERIVKRDSEKDHISFGKFLADEEREMSDDPSKMNLRKCIELADYKIMNNSTIESLNKKITKILYEIQKGGKERKK